MIESDGTQLSPSSNQSKEECEKSFLRLDKLVACVGVFLCDSRVGVAGIACTYANRAGGLRCSMGYYGVGLPSSSGIYFSLLVLFLPSQPDVVSRSSQKCKCRERLDQFGSSSWIFG